MRAALALLLLALLAVSGVRAQDGTVAPLAPSPPPADPSTPAPASVPAPAPDVPAPPVFTKPVIDPAAALNPATPRSTREVKPVFVPYTVPAENAPVLSAPADNLSKPIIYEERPKSTHEGDVPLFGAAPDNLVKAHISKNIFGNSVVFKKAIDERGCPCKRQVPEKYRYDAQYKPEPRKWSKKCCCKDGKEHHHHHKPKLPPIVAEIKKHHKHHHHHNATLPCPKPFHHHHKANVTVSEYYPAKKHHKKHHHLKHCGHNATHAHKNHTITPAFYPPHRLTRAQRKALEEVIITPMAS